MKKLTPTSATVPPVQRKCTSRDLANAVWLRPRDVFDLCGIPSSTLERWYKREHDPLPSSLVKGRGGRRGVRLVKRTDLDAFLERAKV